MHKMTTDAPSLKYIRFNWCSQQARTSAYKGASYCTHPTHDVIGVSSFTSHKNQIILSAVRREYGFSSLSRRLVCRCHALSSQLFEDSECWSGRGSSPRTPAQLTRALQTELTRRWLERKRIQFTATSTQIPNHDTTKKRCDINKQHNKQA